MRLQRRLHPKTSLIDLTPLVDVIFLLLIFFILNADILPLKSLPIEPPTLAISSSPFTSQLVIIADAFETIYVGSNKKMVSLLDLASTLDEEIKAFAKRHQGVTPTLVLSVDKTLSYNFFMQIFAICYPLECPIKLVYQEEVDEKSM